MNKPRKFIKGQHAIAAAAANSLREKRVFYGSMKYYKKYKLNCYTIESSRNELEVNEYFIPYDLSDIISNNKILLIDQIQDPRNLGSIIRSAAAFGYDVLLKESCPINQTVVHCASGGVDNTRIVILKDTQKTLKNLKAKGFFIVGLDERAEYLHELKSIDKIILSVGSEDGLSHLVKKACDIMLKLPTSESFTTLNASVAASIAMCNFRKL